MTQGGTNHGQQKDSNPELDTVADLNVRVERSLKRRTAAEGTTAAKVEETLKEKGAKAWTMMKKRPSLGVLLTGGLAIVIADAVGVGELAFAVIAGYAAYQVLRKGVPANVAIEEAIEKVEKA